MLYELTCLINPELNEEQAAGCIQKFTEKIAENGKVITTGNPKKIKLSYPIQKQNNAFLTSIAFEATPERIEGIKTQLDKDTAIMRFLVVKTKPEAERQEKPKEEARTEQTKLEPSKPLKEKKPAQKGKRKKEITEKKEEEILSEKSKESTKKVEMEKIEEDLNKIMGFSSEDEPKAKPEL